MRCWGNINAVRGDKGVLEEVGKIQEEDMEDDTMVKQVGNVMHACKKTVQAVIQQ